MPKAPEARIEAEKRERRRREMVRVMTKVTTESGRRDGDGGEYGEDNLTESCLM
jgi:hypothetical protein